jgi:IS30 family transposase
LQHDGLLEGVNCRSLRAFLANQSEEHRTRQGAWERVTIIGKDYKQALFFLPDRNSRLEAPRQGSASNGRRGGDSSVWLLEYASVDVVGRQSNDEHTNDLIRLDFQKHRSFRTIIEEEIPLVMTKLNYCRRKVLGFKTSNRVGFGLTVAVAS